MYRMNSIINRINQRYVSWRNLLNFPVLGLFLLMMWLGQSCEEPYDVELDSTWNRLAVESIISTDTGSHFVRITKSADYFSSEAAEGIEGAQVWISDGMQDVVLYPVDSLPGVYVPPPGFYARENALYVLHISQLDIDEDGVMEAYRAQSPSVAIPKPDSIELEAFNYSGFVSGYQVKLFMQDPPAENYYLFRVSVNQRLITDTVDEVTIVSDDLFNGNYLSGLQAATLVDFNQDEKLVPGDTVCLEVIGIDKTFFRYINELKQTVGFQNPLFGGPPANPVTNIVPQENAVGFFGVYSTACICRVLE